MRNRTNDPRRQRKADQRRQMVFGLALLGILCFVITISIFSINYVHLPAKKAIVPTFTPVLNTPASESHYPDTPVITVTHAKLEPLPTPEDTQIQTPNTDEQIKNMSLAQKTGQMILMGVGGKEITSGVCEIVKEVMPGGIVFDGGNVTDADQLRRFIADLRNCAAQTSPIPLFFAIDHEGQYINRFKVGNITIFPSAQAIGATNNPQYAYNVALASGEELTSIGINMVLGPDADVLTNYDNTVIGERSFGSDAKTVGAFVAQAVKGYQKAGLVPVLKHFPGHGASDTDSHKNLPVDDSTLASLSLDHFPPFLQGIQANAQVVMIGHTALPQIDSTNMPASLSKNIVNLLRTRLGFQGVIITDSLEMGALQNIGLDSSAIALASVNAGVDMLLILPSTNAQVASKHLQQAIQTGEIPIDRINGSVRRILSLKAANHLLAEYPPLNTPDFNTNAALANDVGRHAVAVIKNDVELIPIPENLINVLLITPPNNAWDLQTTLKNQLESQGFSPKILSYPEPWADVAGTSDLIDDLVNEAIHADLTIIFTWQAHTNQVLYNDNWQGRLVNKINQQPDVKLIVVALKSPTDILEFPNISTFIATFGTTPGQIQALADILSGNQAASGVNPLSQLP